MALFLFFFFFFPFASYFFVIVVVVVVLLLLFSSCPFLCCFFLKLIYYFCLSLPLPPRTHYKYIHKVSTLVSSFCAPLFNENKDRLLWILHYKSATLYSTMRWENGAGRSMMADPPLSLSLSISCLLVVACAITEEKHNVGISGAATTTAPAVSFFPTLSLFLSLYLSLSPNSSSLGSSLLTGRSRTLSGLEHT